MNKQIKQIETPDYAALIAQLHDRQLALAIAGRYRESNEIAQRIKQVLQARRRTSSRFCMA